MADLSYAEQLPVDDASKKFLGVLVDNSGTNEFTSISGSTRRVINGEPVTDMDVNVRDFVTGGMPFMDHYTVNAAGADQTLTVDDTVGGVQLAALDAATTHVLMTLGGGEIRFTLDGTAPLASSGHRMFPHDALPLVKSVAAAAKFIRGFNAMADGKLYVSELIERAILTTT